MIASPVSIAMCWDGDSPAAELRINGLIFTGNPRAVQTAFTTLNALRDRASAAEVLLDALRRGLDDLTRKATR